jgi:hypothetical protein
MLLKLKLLQLYPLKVLKKHKEEPFKVMRTHSKLLNKQEEV